MKNRTKEVVGIILSVIIFTFIFSMAGVDPLHDGIMFKTAFDMAHGKTLYTQTYTHYGIISAFIQLLSLKLFGNYILSLRIITAVFYGFLAGELYLIWLRILPKKQAVFAIGLWIFLAPYLGGPFYSWSNVYALFFLLLTIHLFLMPFDGFLSNKIFTHKQPHLLFMMGITSALAFYSKQSHLLVFMFLILYFMFLPLFHILPWRTAIKRILIIGAGFTAVSAAVIGWVIYHHALLDFWKQTIRIGYSNGRISGASFNILNVLRVLLPDPIWLLIPISSLYLFYKSLKGILSGKNINTHLKMFGFCLLSFSSLLQFYPNYELSHRYWAIAPALGIFVYILSILLIQFFHNNSRKITIQRTGELLMIIIFIFAIAKEGVTGLRGIKQKITQKYVKVTSPRVLSGLLLSQEEADYYTETAKIIDDYFLKYPKKYFVVDTEEALFMTFTKRAENMTPMFANYSSYTSGFYPFIPRLYEYIKINKPLVMEYSDRNLFEGYYELARWEKMRVVLMAPLEK